MDLERAEEKDIAALSALASRIVKEYYDPLLGAKQNDYMIAKFQSPEAIASQMAAGYRYYFLLKEGERVGFLGFYPRGEEMYISKLYLQRSARGSGLGKIAFDFVVAEARREGKRAVTLNVNKYNPTIAVYEALGMKRVRAECNDIGNGYFMDDYVYRYDL